MRKARGAAAITAPFTYDLLPAPVAEMVRLKTDEIRRSNTRLFDAALTTGANLLTVKEALPHGAFGPWLAAEFGWSERTAENYMRLAETYGPNPQPLRFLHLRTAYALAASSTPELARREVDDLIEAGGKPSEREVQDIIRRHRAKAKAATAQVVAAEARESPSPYVYVTRDTPTGRQLLRMPRKTRREASLAAEWLVDGLLFTGLSFGKPDLTATAAAMLINGPKQRNKGEEPEQRRQRALDNIDALIDLLSRLRSVLGQGRD